MSELRLSLTATCDRRLADSAAPTENYIEFSIQATTVSSTAERPPLNLGLVLDRSGSMLGRQTELRDEGGMSHTGPVE